MPVDRQSYAFPLWASGSLNITVTDVVRANRTPLYSGLLSALPTQASQCEDLSITVASIDHFTVRITFSQAVEVNRALLDPLNYIFTPTMTVNSITPNSSGSASYVDCNVTDMTNQLYSVNILSVEPS